MKWLTILAVLAVMLIGLPSLLGYLMKPPARLLTEFDLCIKATERIPCFEKCETLEECNRCADPIEKCVDAMIERVNRAP